MSDRKIVFSKQKEIINRKYTEYQLGYKIK